jgi:ABC-2 type transport system permease protein
MEQPSRSIGNYEDGAESTRSTGQTLQFNLFIAQAFLKRDTLNELSYRFSFLLQLLGILFSIGVFYFIAELFGEAATPYLEQYGGDYFSFVLIGIAFSGYFGVGLSGFSNSLRRSQTTGTLEAMLTTPTSLSTIIISSSLWDYLLTTVRVFIYLFIGVTLLGVELQDGNYFAAIIILILTIITFSSLGIIAASFIMVVKRGDPITWIVSSLSSLLGGVYYPIEILPEWMQLLARLIPVTYALEAMRLALLEGASISTLYPDILALIIFSVLLLPLSLFSFRFAVNRAKLDGSLTHY